MKWNQRKKQQKVFEKLKERFTIKLILITPDLNKEIRIEANGLNFTIEGMLLIKYKAKKWRPVAYISKLLNKTKINYKIYNKKCW